MLSQIQLYYLSTPKTAREKESPHRRVRASTHHRGFHTDPSSITRHPLHGPCREIIYHVLGPWYALRDSLARADTIIICRNS